jgi:hypothetical protein
MEVQRKRFLMVIYKIGEKPQKWKELPLYFEE